MLHCHRPDLFSAQLMARRRFQLFTESASVSCYTGQLGKVAEYLATSGLGFSSTIALRNLFKLLVTRQRVLISTRAQK